MSWYKEIMSADKEKLRLKIESDTTIPVAVRNAIGSIVDFMPLAKEGQTRGYRVKTLGHIDSYQGNCTIEISVVENIV
jgi:hypothetical protein